MVLLLVVLLLLVLLVLLVLLAVLLLATSRTRAGGPSRHRSRGRHELVEGVREAVEVRADEARGRRREGAVESKGDRNASIQLRPSCGSHASDAR